MVVRYSGDMGITRFSKMQASMKMGLMNRY